MLRGLAIVVGCGTVLIAGTARAQLVVGSDASGNRLFLIDVTGTNPPRLLDNTIDVRGIAADDASRVLYITDGSTLFRAAYTDSGMVMPMGIGAIREGAVARSMTALAYDSVDGQLIGRGSGGLYRINTTTAAATLVLAMSAQDLGGLDFDPATNAFYAVNDLIPSVAMPGGRGLYRIDKPIESPTFTKLANYPAGDEDIDGLAVGDGHAYLVNDVGAQPHYVWSMASGTYVGALPNPLPPTGATFSGGAWAPGLMSPTGVDLALTLEDAPDPLVVPPGGSITYTLRVRNLGATLAPGVVLTMPLPSGVSFVSASAPGTFAGGVVTANLGAMASQGSATLTLVGSPLAGFVGEVEASASVSTTSTDTNPGNNAASASTTVRGPRADVAVSMTPPVDCVVGAGEVASFGVSVSNAGSESAAGVVLAVDLPAGLAFQSSVPTGTLVGSRLNVALGSMSTGASASVTVNTLVLGGGVAALAASASSTTPDPDLANNAAVRSARFRATPPTAAAARGVFSTLATSPTSLVPGLGGARFAVGIGRPWKSLSGERWILRADTDLPTDRDDVIIVGDDSSGGGGGWNVAVQEGVTLLPDSGLPSEGAFGGVLGINDSGQYAFSGNDTSTTTVDAYVAKWDGFSLGVVAREGSISPAFFDGSTLGSTLGSVTIASGGGVSFVASLRPTGAFDEAIFANDGFTYLSRKGLDAPFDQPGGASHTYSAFDTGAASGTGFFVSADGAAWSATGMIADPDPARVRVGVASFAVKVKEGTPLTAHFGEPTAGGAPRSMHTDPSGNWYATGSNVSGLDWALRNGELVATSGAPIFAGATESFADGLFAPTFFMLMGNGVGDVIVGGTTSASDANADVVLVLNNERVVLRENDPVDLDANGIFDDNVHISAFREHSGFLSDAGELYVVVTLRDGVRASCDGGSNDVGQALVRVSVASAPPPTCEYDFNQDENVDLTDAQLMAQVTAGLIGAEPAWLSGDLNGDENADLTDAQILAAYVASGECGV